MEQSTKRRIHSSMIEKYIKSNLKNELLKYSNFQENEKESF